MLLLLSACCDVAAASGRAADVRVCGIIITLQDTVKVFGLRSPTQPLCRLALLVDAL